MKQELLIGAATLIVSSLGLRQDFNAAQEENERYAPIVVAAIVDGDAATLASIDRRIDYSAGPRAPRGQILTSAEMVELFAGCQAPTSESASQYRDFMTLEFSCPDRDPLDGCVTGDLEVMLFPGSPISIGVREKRDYSDTNCRRTAPPSPPAGSSN